MIGTLDLLREVAAHGEAVHVRKADVEEHEVGLVGIERLPPGRDALDGEALPAKPLREGLCDCILILDQKDPHGSECSTIARTALPQNIAGLHVPWCQSPRSSRRRSFRGRR